jgi:lipopolysaccharide/colanic/teichoic acid biosynthesis glycosyltransferase
VSGNPAGREGEDCRAIDGQSIGPGASTTALSPYLLSRSKRALDLILAVPLAIVWTPIIGLLALGSAVSLRSWPFFTQPRVGHRGAHFRFIKVRTFPRSTPVQADKYALASITTTRFGRFLRRTHLDELPQIYLVCLGSMSLVGPRPEMPDLSERFDPEFARERTRVRPGCTGMWQVSPDAGRLIAEAPEHDLAYLETATCALDLRVLWQTSFGQLSRSQRARRWTNALVADVAAEPVDS